MNRLYKSALFDLENDPSEKNDIANERPDMVEKINKIADSIRQVLGDQIAGIKGKEVRPPGRVK
jgi:arylsulfatase A